MSISISCVLHQLNFELLEQLDITCQWIVDNNIPVPNKEQLRSLLGKSVSLINELRADDPIILQYKTLSRRKVIDFGKRDGTDTEVTEPAKTIN